MKKSVFSLIGFVISVFFDGIAILVLFGIFHLYLQPLLAVKTVFLSINLIAICVLLSFKSYLTGVLSLPYYMSVATMTALYTVMQFAVLGILFFSGSLMLYLTIQLIVLFINGVIITVLAQKGIRQR